MGDTVVRCLSALLEVLDLIPGPGDFISKITAKKLDSADSSYGVNVRCIVDAFSIISSINHNKQQELTLKELISHTNLHKK